MIKSRRKGKDGELELALTLREMGINARRGQQFHGGAESPDVVTEWPIHVECKRVERLDINKAMAQSISDSGDKVPTVISRKNGCQWLFTCRLCDLQEIAKTLIELNK